MVAEQAIDWLDAPIVRVGAPNVPMPYNDRLEKAVIPSQKQIVDAIRALVRPRRQEGMKTLSELFSGEGPVLGTWSQIGAPEVVDILGAAGFHFTILDTEHGSFGMDSIENLVRACDAAGIVPIVRVPSFEQSHITRALDAGAQAVIVPGIRSAEEAARAVAGGNLLLPGYAARVRASGRAGIGSPTGRATRRRMTKTPASLCWPRLPAR